MQSDLASGTRSSELLPHEIRALPRDRRSGRLVFALVHLPRILRETIVMAIDVNHGKVRRLGGTNAYVASGCGVAESVLDKVRSASAENELSGEGLERAKRRSTKNSSG